MILPTLAHFCFMFGNILIYIKLYISVSTHEEVWISIICSPSIRYLLVGIDIPSWIVGDIIRAIHLPLHFNNINNRQLIVWYPTSTEEDWLVLLQTGIHSFIPDIRVSITLKAFAAISATSAPANLTPIQNPICWITNLTICSLPFTLCQVSESPIKVYTPSTDDLDTYRNRDCETTQICLFSYLHLKTSDTCHVFKCLPLPC